MQDNNNAQEIPISNNPTTFGKPKKNKKALYIIFGIIVFVLAIAGAIMLLSLNKKNDVTDKSTETVSASVYVSRFKSSSPEKNLDETLSESKNSANNAIYKIQDDTWIAADNLANVASLVLGGHSEEVMKPKFASILQKLSKDGLKEISSRDYTPTDYDPLRSFVRYFASDTMVCNLANSLSSGNAVFSDIYTLRLSCAVVADYDANKADLASYAKAYATSDKKLDKDVLLANPEPQVSATDKYKNAMLNLVDIGTKDIYTAEFYQIPDGSWHFFAATTNRDSIACSDYSSEDMIKAFTGFICHDNVKNKSSFVQKAQPAPNPDIITSGSGG